VPEFRVAFPEDDAGLHQAELAAAVVALAVVAIGQYLFAGQQRGDAIGELDFATRTARLFADQVKTAGVRI
jgi:hypothetical protein